VRMSESAKYSTPLKDLSLRTSTVSSGSQQEVDSASWTSITSEARNSREIEWMPTDVKSLSSLSESQTGEHCSINVPPLSQFQQIVVDKFPDLRCTMLEDSVRNYSQSSAPPSTCWIRVSCKNGFVCEQWKEILL